VEVIKAKIKEVKAFLYTTLNNAKYLVVDKDLNHSEIEELEEDAKDKESWVWTKKDIKLKGEIQNVINSIC